MGKSFMQGEDAIFDVSLTRDGVIYDVSSDDVIDIQAWLVVGTWRSPMYTIHNTAENYLSKVAGVGNENKIRIYIGANESKVMPIGSITAEIVTTKTDDRYPNDNAEIRIFKSIIGNVQKGLFV